MNTEKNSTTHTPRPWRVQKLHADGVVIRREGFEIATDAFDVVANIHAGAPIRREADAHLIAAAPELLEALKAAACSGCGMYYDEPFVVAPTSPCAHCQKQRAAIAKAEGKG